MRLSLRLYSAEEPAGNDTRQLWSVCTCQHVVYTWEVYPVREVPRTSLLVITWHSKQHFEPQGFVSDIKEASIRST